VRKTEREIIQLSLNVQYIDSVFYPAVHFLTTGEQQTQVVNAHRQHDVQMLMLQTCLQTAARLHAAGADMPGSPFPALCAKLS